MRLLQAATLVMLTTGMVWADDDLSRFHPLPRPSATDDQAAPAIRPPPRPANAAEAQAAGIHPRPRPVVVAQDNSLVSFRPKARPKPQPVVAAPAAKPTIAEPTVQPMIVAPQAEANTQTTAKGSVCKRPDVKGKTLAPIRSSNPGCNVPDAVLVSQVGGVNLVPAARINCEEATALATWVKNGLQPAFNNSIVALNVVDSYSCRSRNNVRGAKTSVHGLGQAIDISGFVTKSGKTYTVEHNYNAQIKAAQKAGCGTFHTILGPGSDGYHENHIHFDVAHHRGDYCH